MAVPVRTFSANVGQASTGAAGPDAIETDLDALFKIVNPSISGGGIAAENMQDGSVTDDMLGNRIADPTIADAFALEGTLTQHLSWITKVIIALKGTVTNWYDAGAATIETIWSKFHSTTGHAHTGAENDGPQIGTAGIADGAITTDKITDGAINSDKIDSDISLVGVPTAPTASVETNTTQIATTEFTNNAISKKIQKPSGLDLAYSAMAWGFMVMVPGHVSMGTVHIVEAVLGDYVITSISPYKEGLVSYGEVKENGVVRVYIQNISSNTLPSGSVYVYASIIKRV